MTVPLPQLVVYCILLLMLLLLFLLILLLLIAIVVCLMLLLCVVAVVALLLLLFLSEVRMRTVAHAANGQVQVALMSSYTLVKAHRGPGVSGPNR